MTPAALAALRQQDRVSFPDLLRTLFAEKHTGPITIHFAQGHPNRLEIPCEPTRIVLDKAGKHAQS